MKSLVQPTKSTKVRTYTILERSYEEEAALIFTPDPDTQQKLTAKQFNQQMFKDAKDNISSPQKQIQYKALVSMRQIVSVSEIRPITFVMHYIKEHLIDICQKYIQQCYPPRLRYEACYILENIANDSGLCLLLISKRKYIETLLRLLGKQQHIQIRDRATEALRKAIDQICVSSPTQDQQLITKIQNKVVSLLGQATKRIQVRQIVRIAQRVYKSGLGSGKLKEVSKVCQIYCQVINQNLLKLQTNEKVDLVCVLQGLQFLFQFHNKKQIVSSCMKNYKILDRLMEYAESDELYSQPAMKLFSDYVSSDQRLPELVQNNKFFEFGISLAKNHQKKLTDILEFCTILRRMAKKQQFIKVMLFNSSLLKILSMLLEQNDQLQQTSLQFTYVLCEIYQNMIEKAPQDLWDQIIDLIIGSNVLQAMVKIISLDKEGKMNYLARGLRMIENLLIFGNKKEINAKIICERFWELEAAQKIEKFEEDPNSNIKNRASRIKMYWPKMQIKQIDSSKQDKSGKQGKKSEQDNQGKQGNQDNKDNKDKIDKKGGQENPK